MNANDEPTSEDITDETLGRLGKGMGVQFTTILIPAVLTAFLFFMIWATQNGNHNEEARAAQATETRNGFWKQLAGEEPFKTKTMHGKLARDITPLLDDAFVETIPESNLIPQTIETIKVPDHTYGEIRKELGMNVFQGEDFGTDECIDCGFFEDGFVAKAKIAKDGDWQRLQDPVPAADKAFEFTPEGTPILLFWGGFFLLVSTIGFLVAWAIDSDSTGWSNRDRRPDKWWRITRPFSADGLDLDRLGVALLSPLVGIPRLLFNIPFGGWRYLDAKFDTAKAERERRAKENAPSPVSSELALARTNYNRLRELPAAQQALPEVKKALKDTAALIQELQQFPHEMSAKAARLMARQILADNQDLRDRPKAVLAADDEVQHL